MLVLLRLALGWHFLYEGVWKVRHPDQFQSETVGFLSAARGPLAPYFNRLVPDIDGYRRLVGNLSEDDVKDAKGNAAKQTKLAKSWDDLRQKFVDFYRPAEGKDDLKKLHEQLTQEAQKIYEQQVKGLKEFVEENGDKITEHFDSLGRYNDGRKTDPSTPFMTQRRWDEMQDLRNEAKGWVADLDARENALKADLMALVTPKEDGAAAAGAVDLSPLAKDRPEAGPFAAKLNPLDRAQRMQTLALVLKWSLLVIGLCLMLGLFTRPAALAGAGFLLFVVLSQPSYPGVYPLDPPQMGHTLLVNKDFIEMISLLLIASTSLNRWTGLDFFVYNLLIKPFCGKCCNRGDHSTT